MQIRVDGVVAGPERDVLALQSSSWNDFWKYATQFFAAYYDADGVRHELGGVKIGQFGLQPGDRLKGVPPSRPELVDVANGLPSSLFSLGNEVAYYEAVAALGDAKRQEILAALRDVAFDAELFARAKEEYVFSESLTRDISYFEVSRQWARVAHGGVALTDYDFAYHVPSFMSAVPLAVQFKVAPYEMPPSNIQVIIGRNGVGKSTMLRYMAQSLIPEGRSAADVGRFQFGEDSADGFANVVSLSYSVFDQFSPIDHDAPLQSGYTHVDYSGAGLEEADSGESASSYRLGSAAERCSQGPKKQRLLDALHLLENDPLFEEQGLSDLLAQSPPEVFQVALPETYGQLSSGHKIVLNSVMRLVDAVEEKTLVLLDEPETHLHPPLLSAYIRALSDLLTNRNGVAIIATHSPVVLQEVPSNCVWSMARSGTESRFSRPEIETFGENVGLLTNEVFGLEVTGTGYHSILTKVATGADSYDDAVDGTLHGRLGTEGRAILRSRILRRLAGK